MRKTEQRDAGHSVVPFTGAAIEVNLRYAWRMATMFIQQSNEYIQQIEAEIERLQQLRDQVMMVIQNEEQLETEAPARKRAAKIAGTKAASKKVPAKKRGRPKASEVQTEG